MIRVFGALDRTFTTNGDAVIEATKARVFNADNGEFYLELTCGSEYSDYLKDNNIIVVPTPQGEQAFRIRYVNKSKNRIDVKALHVYYDSDNYLLADSYAVNKTCHEALDYFNKSTDTQSPFTVYSDIDTIDSYRCVRTPLSDCINTIIERWGGHLVRDNWAIAVMDSIGVDNGITIEYKKNLKELSAEYDWSGVCTKLLPVGRDGILLDDLYVISPTQYLIPFTKTESFDQSEFNEDDYKDAEGNIDTARWERDLKSDLYIKAVNYLNDHALPSINYTLKADPEKVTDIGDTIEVRDSRIGVDILTKVISYEYDSIRQRYVELQFGNFTKDLSGLLPNIANETNKAISYVNNSLADGKQDRLNAGEHITINNNTIGVEGVQGELSAGDYIGIENDTIRCTLQGGDGITIRNAQIETKQITEQDIEQALTAIAYNGAITYTARLDEPCRNKTPVNARIEGYVYPTYGSTTGALDLTGVSVEFRRKNEYNYVVILSGGNLSQLTDGCYILAIEQQIEFV